jgi:hypothetical protein
MSESVKWVKARASGSSGGNCVEVARLPDRARLVRDSKNRAGVVLRFSPGAWRRFADEVKRSLAGPGAGPGGHSRVVRCPFGLSGGASRQARFPFGPCPGFGDAPGGRAWVRRMPSAVFVVFLVTGGGPRPGVGAAAYWFPSLPGSARYASRSWCAERALGPGEGRKGPGNRETGLWGVSGFPGVCTFRQPEVAARYSCLAVRSAAPCALSTVTQCWSCSGSRQSRCNGR